MIELLILIALIALNGVFAMAELAIVSAREIRLEQLAEKKQHGAKTALALAQDPTRFLAAVQIGITLIGILAGAFGGAALSDDLAQVLNKLEALRPYSDSLAFGLIVLLTTYLSLVIGELLPKRLALQYAEVLACWLAPPMQVLATFTAPLVTALSYSTDFLLALMQIPEAQEPTITEEEVMAMVERGTVTGVFERVEQDMLEGVLSLDDQRAAAVMIPRTEIIWLNINDSPDVIRQTVLSHHFSAYPVGAGSLDRVLGILRVKDWMVATLSQDQFDLKSILQTTVYVPETLHLSRLLERFKTSRQHVALVVNEHGGVEGLVTLNDVLAEIIGELEADEPQAIQREDGTWLLDGLLPLEDVAEVFPSFAIPQDEKGMYLTLGGFVITRLGMIPKASDHFLWEEWRFEVMDMDGNRVDKVLVSPRPQESNIG